jgi:hypothetical protein
MTGGDLDKENERLRLVVKLALEDTGCFLDVALGSYCVPISITPILPKSLVEFMKATHGSEQSEAAAGIFADP